MKRTFLLMRFFLIMTWTVLPLQADDFVSLDWKELKIGDELPYYSTTIPVGDNYSAYTYDIRVEYPEYKELTTNELTLLKRLKPILADTVIVQTSLGISRKQGILDVSFIPFIKVKNRYYKLLNCKLSLYRSPVAKARFMQDASTLLSARYTDTSVLSTGKWVKIRVPKEGIYMLTKSQLSSMGFTNADKVKLYGYGGRLQNKVITYEGANADCDDLEEVPLYKGEKGFLFYAEGVIRWSDWTYSSAYRSYISTRTNNPYSSYSYYFLTEGEAPMAFPEADSPTGTVTNTLSNFPEHTLYEKDEYCWYNSGNQLYDNYDFANGNIKSYTINTPGAVADQNFITQLSFTASNSSPNNTRVDLTVNDNSIGGMTLAYNGKYDRAIQSTSNFVKKNMLNDGANTFKLTTTASRSARLDYICLNYIRELKMTEPSLLFSHYEKRESNFSIQNTTSTTQVWRIGRTGQPTALQKGTYANGVLTVPVSDPSRRYVALDVTATYPAPTFVSNIENQNLHADKNYDMVVILPTSGKLIAQAQRLVDAHTKNDSLRTKIVRADQIYNEFSSGTPDAMAYRRYLKMLYDRAETEAGAPRYLLLFGDCAWDNRMLSSAWKLYNPDDFLLCYESDHSLSETGSFVTDDFFGFLDDGEGNTIVSDKLDLGIGRFPVRSEDEAQIMVDKAIKYMENKSTGAWKNTICMMGDDGDLNQHMADAEEVAKVIEEKHPAYQVKRVYWDAYTRETSASGNSYPTITKLLKELMNKGTLVMNYTGHGAPYTISPEQVLKLADFKAFSSPNIPLWVSASCEITPFDTQEENIGEVAVMNPKGGAIAFFSAARSVYSSWNRSLNKYFMDYVLGKDEKGDSRRLGDAVRLAKVRLVSGTTDVDKSENKLKYALMGDPALRLATPTYKVVADSLNGTPFNSEKLLRLQAGQKAHITGHLEDTEGKPVTNYQGAVTATILDKKVTITCHDNVQEGKKFTFEDRPSTIYEGIDSIRNGRFSLSFLVPLEISYSNETARLNLYSVGQSGSRQFEGQGVTERLHLSRSDSTIVIDSTKTADLYIYLNRPDFQDGGVVNKTPYFVALINDSNGINTSGNGLGHDLELIIDGKAQTSYVLNNYFTSDFGSYTKGTVRFVIPELSEGKHQLLFRTWNMYNISTSSLLNFVVSNDAQPDIIDIDVMPNPASEKATFTVRYDRPESDVTINIEVFDSFGRKVWEKTESGYSSSGYYTLNWNLSTTSGNRLNHGIYFFKAGISGAGTKETTQVKKIIIVNNK